MDTVKTWRLASAKNIAKLKQELTLPFPTSHTVTTKNKVNVYNC